MQDGLQLYSLWINEQDWKSNKKTHDVKIKVETLQKMPIDNFHKYFPVKISKVSTDDYPWYNDKLKHLKQLKCREFIKQRSSEKWHKLNKVYKTALTNSKTKLCKGIVKDIKLSNPSQWYSKLKQICSFDQERYEPMVCDEIKNQTRSKQTK